MYDYADYAAMMTDPVRGRAYLDALRSVVRPGCVVADIGAGPGVLGVAAARLGARRVFLVEPSGVVEAARALARENGVEDRVEIIEGISTGITLPERADVIVCDLRGVLPLFGDHLRAAADMRARLLADGGVCIPARDALHLGIVEDEALHARTAGVWRGLDHAADPPLDLRSLARIAHSTWYRTHATAEQMLAPSSFWTTLEYGAPMTATHAGRATFRVARAGTMHGLLCWFDASLTDTIGFSNAPSAPRALYGQAFFPLGEPSAVEPGDLVDASLRAVLAGADYQWVWSLTVRRGDATLHHARHATLDASPDMARAIAMFDGTREVGAIPDAAPTARLIALAGDRTTLDAIASALHDEFPDRFTTRADALAFAVRRHTLLSE